MAHTESSLLRNQEKPLILGTAGHSQLRGIWADPQARKAVLQLLTLGVVTAAATAALASSSSYLLLPYWSLMAWLVQEPVRGWLKPIQRARKQALAAAPQTVVAVQPARIRAASTDQVTRKPTKARRTEQVLEAAVATQAASESASRGEEPLPGHAENISAFTEIDAEAGSNSEAGIATAVSQPADPGTRKRGRGRSKSRPAEEPKPEPEPARWVRVGPGKFVRLDASNGEALPEEFGPEATASADRSDETPASEAVAFGHASPIAHSLTDTAQVPPEVETAATPQSFASDVINETTSTRPYPEYESRYDQAMDSDAEYMDQVENHSDARIQASATVEAQPATETGLENLEPPTRNSSELQTAVGDNLKFAAEAEPDDQPMMVAGTLPEQDVQQDQVLASTDQAEQESEIEFEAEAENLALSDSVHEPEYDEPAEAFQDEWPEDSQTNPVLAAGPDAWAGTEEDELLGSAAPGDSEAGGATAEELEFQALLEQERLAEELEFQALLEQERIENAVAAQASNGNGIPQVELQAADEPQDSGADLEIDGEVAAADETFDGEPITLLGAQTVLKQGDENRAEIPPDYQTPDSADESYDSGSDRRMWFRGHWTRRGLSLMTVQEPESDPADPQSALPGCPSHPERGPPG